MADRIQLRRDTAANWTAYNPILLEGEPGIEIDTDQWKLGDGVHTWSQLAYRGGECVQQRGQSTTVAMSQKAVTDELNLIGVFDISAYHATGGVLAKYADLAAALGTNGANVLEQYRVPGMTIRYVQSSDNKYVQFRCKTQSFSANPEDWYFCGKNTLINNPEFLDVTTDSHGRILWAIKTDGSIYYGAGVPQQVIDYVNDKISELSLDEYENIVDFLGSLIERDKTLQQLLNEKVDKETGKSLIPTKFIQTIENPEFLVVWTDTNNKIVFGIKTDGDTLFGVGVPSQIVEYVRSVVGEIHAETIEEQIADINRRIPTIFSDPEDRLFLETDKDGRILSYRDKSGKKHEEAGLEVSTLDLTSEGKTKLQNELSTNRTLITLDLEWENKKFIGRNGDQICAASESYSLSKPFKIYKGETVNFATNVLSMMVALAYTYDERGNVIQPLEFGTGSQHEYSHTFERTGYMRISALASSLPTVTLERLYNKVNISDISEQDKDYLAKKDYMDIEDFSPENIGSILCYEGGTKSVGSHIVNAVAYPDGQIIACRDNGTVVKIDKSGNETTLLTVSAGWDWRGLFIAKNNVVYVSPHKSQGSGTLLADRGLYRLGYNENSFTKVVSLYHSSEECGISITPIPDHTTSDINFIQGNLYYNGTLYVCNTAYSGKKIDTTKCSVYPIIDWASSTSYSKGDIRKNDGVSWVCHTAHTSAGSFDESKWYLLTTCMENDDTFWTMCEDRHGYIYGGIYAHTKRPNPSVYCSKDGGNTWELACNLLEEGYAISENNEASSMHIHCITYNKYDDSIIALVGEIEDAFISKDFGDSWERLGLKHEDDKDTVVISVPDGLIFGSDYVHQGIITKRYVDGRIKTVGKLWHAEFFGLRQSDVTGWIYAFSKIESAINGDTMFYPPYEAIESTEVLETWIAGRTPEQVGQWEMYKNYVHSHYDTDDIHPYHAVILVSKDYGETWEIICKIDTTEGGQHTSAPGIFCVGYFRNGECLCGVTKSGANGHHFVNPIVISEGKHNYTSEGLNLQGEIFIKTNNSTIINV